MAALAVVTALRRAARAAGSGERRTLFQLLVGELDRVVGLEAEEGVDLTRRLRVVLLSDRQLVHADERDDLEPARRRNRADRRDAARDVVEVEVLRRREQLVRRREELRTRVGRRVSRSVGRRASECSGARRPVRSGAAGPRPAGLSAAQRRRPQGCSGGVRRSGRPSCRGTRPCRCGRA